MALNIALKIAFIESGVSQIRAAAQLGIDHTKLSRIIHGHTEASAEEKRVIAKFLKRKVDQLFPGVAA